MNGAVLWIEGPIGAGKSTLARLIRDNLDHSHLIEEPVEENPYLGYFYKIMGERREHSNHLHLQIEASRIAFEMQIWLLHRRFRHQMLASALAMNGEVAILDRGLPGDSCFVEVLLQSKILSPRQRETYREAYTNMAHTLVAPGHMIYLDCTTQTLYDRCLKRARPEEKDSVSYEYLGQLNSEYSKMLDDFPRHHPWCRGTRIHTWDWNEPETEERVMGRVREMLC